MAYPDYLRNRVIPIEILMDKLKVAYPDKFLCNRETQIELLARVAVGFLDGAINDIDDPTPVFTDFEFKGDYGKGMDARKVEIDLSEISEEEQHIINGYVEKHSEDTDHARAYQTAIERLEHVKKCIAEKKYVDRVKDKKGTRTDWIRWIEHCIEKKYLHQQDITVNNQKKTVYVMKKNTNIDVD
jgi:hypothetical protein